jgi:hypothetical protein
MSPTQCPRCGRPVRDGYVCHQDAQSLADDLREAAGHAEDAWTVIARQTRYGGGLRGNGDQPLPVDFTASGERAVVDNTITTWARHIADTRNTERAHGPTCATHCEHRSCDAIRYQQTPTALPEAARWLAGQLGWLRARPEAAKAFDELHHACAILRRLVDRPGVAGLRLVGMCDCGRILYAPHGRDVVQCKASNCGATWNVDESQAILRGHLDNRHVTAAEAAHLAGFIDTGRTGNQIRKLINKWAERNQIDTHQVLVKHQHRDTCEPDCTTASDTIATYRFGDVADRIASTPRRAAQAAGMGA